MKDEFVESLEQNLSFRNFKSNFDLTQNIRSNLKYLRSEKVSVRAQNKQEGADSSSKYNLGHPLLATVFHIRIIKEGRRV